jgi:two-component system NtrC family sensor kinase
MILRLRTRLVLGLLLPIIIVGLISTFVGAGMIGRSLSLQAQHNLQLDLNSARLIYNKALDEMQGPVRFTAFDPAIRNALAGGPIEPALSRMNLLRKQHPLDILDLLDPSGKVVIRARTPSRSGDSLAADPTIRAVMEGREYATSTAIATSEELRQEADELADLARIPIPATPDSPASVEERGLLIKTAVAVKADDGRLLGILYGARLLNRDEHIVDDIYRTVFKGESYEGRQVGEATICLDDVRISTLVLQDGHRAIGTRIAPSVRNLVMNQGLPWVGRASVIGAWHLTAYEPILDISGRVIGNLAIGILEKKLTVVRQEHLAVFLAITLGGVILSLIIASLMARNVTTPMRKLLLAVQQVAGGNLEHQVDTQSSVHEIAQIGRHFNRMSLALKERDLVIRRQTEEKISRSERLTIVGRLAAGVAHQINNPLGGIMLFSNLLLRKAPERGIERENLERISNEAKRCQKIVQGLLDFARNREPKLELTFIKDVIDKALQLVENQAMFLDIQLERRHASDLPMVRVDVAQMQEVFLNLILNAVESMGGRGKLIVLTEVTDEGNNVRISIADSGHGIPENLIERIFEPFFTTKEEGKGTGLGLSISRGIVETHGGNIWARSKPGEGTTFFIRLPAAAVKAAEGVI